MDAQRNPSGTEERADARRPHDVDRLAELVQRAQQGDTSVIPALRDALEAAPSVWREYGDLAAQAQEAWLQLLSGTDYMLAESVRLKLSALRQELGAEGASPLEKLLVERVATTWVQASYSDILAAQMHGGSPRLLEAAEKRRDRAHKRHLMAIAALATVRKLLPAGAEATASVTEVGAATRTDADEGKEPTVTPAVVAYPRPANRH